MENPSFAKVMNLNVSIDEDTKQRILRVKHAIEKRDGKTCSVSQLIRQVLREFEQTLTTTV